VLVSAAIRDISDRKQVEAHLRESLTEKELLLREIHHRVKNNLQIVSSLLNLQQSTLQDPAAIEAVAESSMRVRAMALLHQMLYQSESVGRVSMRDYLHALALQIRGSHASAGVELRFDLDAVTLDPDRAIPCGLIVTELLTNCFKHAFDGGRGTVTLSLKEVPDASCALTVLDNGRGFANAITEVSSSLGLRLVRAWTKQMAGALSVSNQPVGTLVTLTFPLRTGREAVDPGEALS
jgi:two-component system, sensor histidine kinase PdtaS